MAFRVISLSVLMLGLAFSMAPAGIWAQNQPKPVAKEVINSIGMKLVCVSAGKFSMGSTDEDIAHVRKESKINWYVNESPRHEVEISKDFYMAIFPVTQAQYRQVTGKNPSWFSSQGGGKDDILGLKTDDFPVESVSWQDAKDFCGRLGLKEGKTYRLPTEAEWEYACRAGTASEFYNGDGEKAMKEVGWYAGNSDGRPHPIGQLAPNAWGLYDMCGNVCQWCADWFDPDYYAGSPRKDPSGPAVGECRVLRGGSWLMTRWGCRSASRHYGRHDNRDNDCGFRIILVIEKEKRNDAAQMSIGDRTVCLGPGACFRAR